MKRIFSVLLCAILCLSFMPVSALAAEHSISGANVQLLDNEVYTGQAFTPKVSAEFCGLPLVEGTDYTLSYSDNTLSGIATVTLTGKGSFSGTKDVHFLIRRADISSAEVSGITDVFPSGERITQDITVTLNGTVLKEGVDWSAHYYQNVRPGIAKILIMGIGNYTGVIEKTFSVNYPGDAKSQTVDRNTPTVNISLEAGQPLELSVGSLGSNWSFDDYSISDGRKISEKETSVIFTKAGSYTITCGFDYYYVGYRYVDGVLRQVVETGYDSCTLKITVTDNGDAVKSIEFLDYKNDTPKALNLLLQVKGDNAAGAELSWTSSDTSVAEVDSFGHVTVKKAGETTITASTADGTNLKIELALDALNIASKGKILGLYKDKFSGDYSIKVAYGNEVLYRYSDYMISSITEQDGFVTVVITGTGVYGGTLTAVLPAPDFDSIQYGISTSASEGGSVSVSPARASYGQIVTITATPDDGYQLHEIYLDGELFSDESFVVRKNHTVYARFIPAAQGDLWDGTSKTAFAAGSGTKADPYQISSAANLAYLAEQINAENEAYVSAHYILMCDIDLAGHEWTPIGKGPIGQYSDYLNASSTKSFRGTFDGNGRTIYNLSVKANKNTNYSGLFGTVHTANIHDLTIRNASVEIKYDVFGYYYNYGGILAGGASNSEITNCAAIDGYVQGLDDYSTIGGLIGIVSASSNSDGSVDSCASSVTLKGTASYGGGLIGELNHSTITKCMSAGKQLSSADFGGVGGLVGLLYSGSIRYCQSAFDEMSASRAGGFVGYADDATISDSFCTGSVAGDSYAGGFAGTIPQRSSCTITNCWSGSHVSSTDTRAAVGGFVGECQLANPVKRSFFVGTVDSSNDYVGALFGRYSGNTSNLDSSYYAKLQGGTTELTKLCGNHSTPAPKNLSEADQMSEDFYSDELWFYMGSVWKLDGNMLYLNFPALTVDKVEVEGNGEPLLLHAGQPIPSNELTLKITYGNGIVSYVESGYTITGSTDTPGQIQLTVSIGGASTTCSATVMGDYFAHVDSITKDLASITAKSKTDCLLIVAVYKPDGRMVGCASKRISAGMEQINLYMGLQEVPEEYTVNSFFVNRYSYKPLS